MSFALLKMGAFVALVRCRRQAMNSPNGTEELLERGFLEPDSPGVDFVENSAEVVGVRSSERLVLS
jgi:hypothetical protein